MDNTEVIPKSKIVKFMNKHSFSLFIILAITISSVIVLVSMELYNISGAAQLDLSRPGYKSVRSQAMSGNTDLKAFSGNGTIDQGVINDFKSSYEKQSEKVKAVDAFGGDPLSPNAPGFNTTN